jgi:DNA-binding ferritin-like protein (Dps family)
MSDKMDMLEEHKQARKNKVQIRLHEFKSTYRKTSRIIYAFCEGKDDITFFKSAIEGSLVDDWTVHLWEVGGVDKVIQLYGKFDWRRYDKSQIIFFIDRDLAEFTGVNLPNEKNVYITDNYSIENDVVNWNTCERILTEVLGFNNLSLVEKNKLKQLFNTELSKFTDQMVPIMSWIVKWIKSGQKACLDNISMNHLFILQCGSLKSVAKPKQCQDATEYIHKQCNLPIDPNYDFTAGCAEFCIDNRHKRFTRGKYLLWFFVEFCLSIHKDCPQIKIIQTISTKPKNKVNLSQSNAIILISSRFRVPSSLKDFLRDTVESFVKKWETA